MAVRRVILWDLHPQVGGAIVRDPMTGDWLVIMSPRIDDPGAQCEILNALLEQLGEWERRAGVRAVSELRLYLQQLAG